MFFLTKSIKAKSCKGLIVLLLFILNAVCLYAQNFQWAYRYGGTGNDRLHDITIDVDGNNSFCGIFFPTITLGSYTLTTTSSIQQPFIAKSDINGNVQWAIHIAASNSTTIDRITNDKRGNIYLTGSYRDTIWLTPSIYLVSKPGYSSAFVASYNSNGLFRWVINSNQTGNGNSRGRGIVTDDSCNVYIAGTFQSTSFTFGSHVINPVSTNDCFLLKIDSTGQIKWLNSLISGPSNINNMDINLSGELFITGNMTSTVTIGPYTLSPLGTTSNALAIKANRHGQILKAVRVAAVPSSGSFGWAIAKAPAGGFYVSGDFRTTAQFGNGITLNQTTTTGNHYFAYYDSNATCIWAKATVNIGAGSSGGQCYDMHSTIENTIYITGVCTGNIRFGDINTFNNQGQIFITKLDSTGNFLWAFRTGSSTSLNTGFAISVDSAGGALIGGFFNNSATFGSTTLTSLGTSDGFLTKISDIGISRTPLTKTVYCAGDSVQVPYTKYNTFHAANRFYAQLSDTAGRFDNPVTIGSRLSNQNGTIACRLPLNLPYSTKYQLRVVSDSPVVQSYYLNQTYTIFPRPVAQTVSNIMLCSGQADTLTAINLNNNTAQWSPATYLTHINDSSVRFTAPANTTASAQLDFVKLLVSNAGGCKDSTIINITIRPKLHVQVSSDTTLCKGQSPTITLRATATGGDSSNYRYLWKDATGKVWSSWSPQDTLPAHTDSTRTYTVYVTDGCTLLPDTAGSAQVTVTIRPPLQLSIQPDTLVCKGSAVTLTALPSGGKADSADSTGTGYYTIQWFTLPDTTTVQHTGSTYSVTVNNNQQYRAKLTDGCTAIPAWSNSITVNTYNNIQLTPRTDTTLNKGQSVTLTAQATQGKGSGYTFTWYKLPDTTTAIATTTSLTGHTTQPDSTTTYRVIATDGCAANTDTAQVEITVRQQLKISIAGSHISNRTHDTIMCTGQSITYTLQANYPSAGQQFTWNQGQGTGSTKTLSPATTTTYRVILSDNQSTPDTVYLTITVRPPLQLHNLQDTTVCQGQSVTFNPFVTGGNNTPPNGYQFLWDDNTTTASKTFNVSTTTITATLTVIDNCSSPQSKRITLTPELNPNINLTGIPAQGCPPLKTTLTNTQNNSGTYTQTWDFGNGQRSQTTTTNNSNNSIAYTYTQQGSYTPTLTLSSARGCKATATLAGSINVATPPVAAFRLSMDTTWITLPKIKITNQSQQADSFFWHFSRLINDTVTTSTSPSTFERHFTDSGLYLIHLKAQSSNGCSDSVTKPLVVLMDYDVWIPTAFSPGAKDNLNPTFGPVGVGIDRYRMIIYNRWGQMVFSSKGPRDTWNGGLNNNADEPLPDGVYVWYLEIYNYHNRGTIKGGTVQIVR